MEERTPGRGRRDHFTALPDPRVDRTKRHPLRDIVTIAVGAVVCGADTWGAVETFGERKEAFLRQFRELPHGIPSHDPCGRVFAARDPAACEGGCLAWVRAAVAATGGPVVAIDGKTRRRSHHRAAGQGPRPLVSAWAAANQVVCGQVAVDEKSNEITAIPALLQVLVLGGGVVTIDAMGGQQAIAATICAGGADYVLALKDTHPQLAADVASVCADALGPNAGGDAVGSHQTLGTDHGRLERRRCWTVSDPAVIGWRDPSGAWAGLRPIAVVEGERRLAGKVTTPRRYYLSRRAGDAARLAAAGRRHWAIANRLHWVLDLAFREDESRVRAGHAAENLAVLRQIALNLLRQERSAKVGVATKRLMAGWDDADLLQILGQ
jgi:predicted transposase YbfD/YdcC